MTKEKMDLHMHECTRLCWECRDICQDILYNHILQRSGETLDNNIIRMLTDCMQICETAADFMRRNSPLHHVLCNACSAVCEATADAGMALQNEHATMQGCIEACRKCASSCRDMSRMGYAA